MKIAVMNFSGNVGKTVVAQHLLAPRMGCNVVSVESVNDDANADIRVRASHFLDIYELLADEGSIVLDVGASNAEEFVYRMVKQEGSHNMVDYFLIPVVPDAKQMKDTLVTIHRLSDLEIPKEKIKVVFNRVNPNEKIEAAFEPVVNYLMGTHRAEWSPEAAIIDNEVYSMMRLDPDLARMSIAELAAEDVNAWQSKFIAAKKAGDMIGKRKALNIMAGVGLANTAKKNLDAVYAALDFNAVKQ
jgi:MinD-like ATPase involved in chromosome partitioning or flagellar assembly